MDISIFYYNLILFPKGRIGLYLKVKSREEILDIISSHRPLDTEKVSLFNAIGRTAAQDIHSPEDMPSFPRATMDGYAVKVKDTFGASEAIPSILTVIGEVRMGQVPEVEIRSGEAVKISTGGMLPSGADGVVMIEYTHTVDSDTIEIIRPISPYENVIRPGEDIKKGERIIKKGDMLRPQDVGVLSGVGITEIEVYRRPQISIVSTGDELISPKQQIVPGKIRDINGYTLQGLCIQEGAVPNYLGICKDNPEELKSMIERGLESSDSVWISGGSSIGVRDITLKVISSFKDTEILTHGISISPGKPTILAKIGGIPVFGLPGHPASSMMVAEIFLRPLLRRLRGLMIADIRKVKLMAQLSRNIESSSGRDDFIRVHLRREGDRWIAEPIFGKSAFISTLIHADGYICIPKNREGAYEGEEVEVFLF